MEAPNSYRNKTYGKQEIWITHLNNDDQWWLVDLYGISAPMGYVMPNPIYTYIKYIIGWLVGFYGV